MNNLKFKPGDKVRIAIFVHGFVRSYNGFSIGSVLTIKEFSGARLGVNFYKVEESERYEFGEDELALIPMTTITIKIPLECIGTARCLAIHAVDEAYKEEEKRKKELARLWTDKEIEKAQKFCIDMVSEVVLNGGYVTWYPECGADKGIGCDVFPNLFSQKKNHGFALPHGSDEYNEWIGKCVSLCNALRKPVPDFIKCKNVTSAPMKR